LRTCNTEKSIKFGYKYRLSGDSRNLRILLPDMGKISMPGIGTLIRKMICWAGLFVALGLSACTTIAPSPIEPIDDPVVVSEPVPVKVVKPQPVLPPEPPRLAPVAIVLTSRQPAFLDVANALTGHIDDFQIFDLSDGSQPPVTVLRNINDSNSGTVVAIGLRAAKSSVAMADVPVIFSQVFNHQDHSLLTENSRGIAPLAPLDAQLAAWIKVDPAIASIGIIVGEGHDDLITEARLAAQKHKIELRVRISHSDQETLYLFRRMSQDIDGFWLFPDNRVLSARSLQKILEAAKRGQVAVAVPYESMLDMGATISLETLAEDIAATIARVVREIQADGLKSIPAISQLSAIKVTTHDAVKVVNR
jgi:ABC-type uncharacterized transport system substrate-binding protein